MTPRLIRFMQDNEHYNPLFTYKRGILQTVPDSLSRMPGLREEGEPADTERFYSIQNFLAAEDNEPAPASKSEPIRIRKVHYYRKLRKYVKATSMLSNTPDNNLKQEASRYEL